jgi:hypothetical protein
MSKYVRTKDRIDLLRKGVDKYIVKDNDYTYERVIDEETLLKDYKVADTIEELCDEFVCYGNNTYSLLDRITTIDKYAVFKDKSADKVSNLIKADCDFYGGI